jgi:MYXO-CTERM domain-containing protein
MIVMRSTPELGGLWDDVTGGVTKVVSTAAKIAVAPITYGVKLNVAAAKGIVGAAAPLATGIISSAAPILRTAGSVVGSGLTAVGQTAAAIRGGSSSYTAPPEPSNLPIILAGVAAAGILGVVLLRRRRA